MITGSEMGIIIHEMLRLKCSTYFKKTFFAYYIHKKILSLQQNRFEMQKLNNRNGNINNDEKVFIDDCCGEGETMFIFWLGSAACYHRDART